MGNLGVLGGFSRQDQSIYSGLNFTDINQMFGATFKPKMQGTAALLAYSGIKFLFKYSPKGGPESSEEAALNACDLNLVPNKLVKITIFNEE